MKKETGIAIFFGVGLGILVALMVIFQSKEKQFSKSKPINNQTKTAAPKIKIVNSSPFIEISFPLDKSVIGAKTVTIKGRANKNSLIVIQSPIKELVFKNNNDNFSQDFPLALGENVIVLTNYPADKNIPATHKQLRIYYLDTKEPVE